MWYRRNGHQVRAEIRFAGGTWSKPRLKPSSPSPHCSFSQNSYPQYLSQLLRGFTSHRCRVLPEDHKMVFKHSTLLPPVQLHWPAGSPRNMESLTSARPESFYLAEGFDHTLAPRCGHTRGAYPSAALPYNKNPSVCQTQFFTKGRILHGSTFV